MTLTTPHDEVINWRMAIRASLLLTQPILVFLKVRIPHPSFRVDKFDELWEFERSSVVDVVSPNLQVEAMVQMKGNCSIVPLEIILANFGGASSYNLCVEFERTRKMEGREEAKTKQLLFLRIKI